MTAARQEPPLSDVEAAYAALGSGDLAATAAMRRAEIDDPGFAARPPDARAAVWLELGTALRELARWREAAEAFQQALALRADLADGWTGLAITLVSLGDPAQALAAAGRALDLAPDAAESHRALALACLRSGRPGDAEAAVNAALTHAPGHPESTATLALIRMMQNRLDDADALFQQALEAKPVMAEAFGNHATALAQLGRPVDAQRQAAQAIRLKPFLPAPFFLLGNLLRAGGKLAEAAEAFAQTLRLAPDHPDARVNLADTLRQDGRFALAADICRKGLIRRPDDIGLLINLGAALQSLGDDAGALAAYGQALERQPDLPEAHNNIARLHQTAGRRDAAIAHLRGAVAAHPHRAALARDLSALLLEDGAIADAEAAARQAARAAPGDPLNQRQLALVLIRQDQAGEAIAAIDAALRLAPEDGENWFQAAAIFLKAGERTRAVPCCREAIRLNAGQGRCWALLAQSLRGLRLQAPDPGLRQLLIRALAEPGAEHAYLMDAAVSAVLLEPALAAVHAAVHGIEDGGIEDGGIEDGGIEDGEAALPALLRRADILGGLADDDLLLALLETAIVTDPALERTLTALRRAVLLAAVDDGISAVDHLRWTRLLAALARQCFLNEYIFAETPVETAAAATLEAYLRSVIERREKPPGNRVALYACYRPLADDPIWRRLPAHDDWLEPMLALFALLIIEPAVEREIGAATPSLTPMDRDPVSRDVRAQYENAPYPRWHDAGLLDAPSPLPRLLRALLPHTAVHDVISPDDPRWATPDVLVAGCGTGRESIWVANQVAGARVLAVDLSRASLAYAQRQTRRLDIGNITYAQADLLELGRWAQGTDSNDSADNGPPRRFDVIHCVGVLHHLGDPLAGWRVLTGLLKPGGVMKLGFYSAIARHAVVAARDLIAERGFEPTLAGIRAFRAAALALPVDHPARPVVDSPDFYNASACRDLVFHVQEHRLTLPVLAAWIGTLGLEFLGFQLDDPATGLAYRRQFPADTAMTDLAAWDRFESENPHIFSGMYQFWVRRPA